MYSVVVSSEAEGDSRWLAQHGGLPGWLNESDPCSKSNFVRDERSIPPALTDETAYLGLGLLSCQRLVFQLLMLLV
jgi:hypothetical protein